MEDRREHKEKLLLSCKTAGTSPQAGSPSASWHPPRAILRLRQRSPSAGRSEHFERSSVQTHGVQSMCFNAGPILGCSNLPGWWATCKACERFLSQSLASYTHTHTHLQHTKRINWEASSVSQPWETNKQTWI